MRDRQKQYNAQFGHHHRDHFHLQAMPLEEVQGLLPPSTSSRTGSFSHLSIFSISSCEEKKSKFVSEGLHT